MDRGFNDSLVRAMLKAVVVYYEMQDLDLSRIAEIMDLTPEVVESLSPTVAVRVGKRLI